MAYNADTMSFDVPDTDCVYISGLPDSVTEADLEQHFGSIGIIKQDKKLKKSKVWLYRDKATGALKGDGTVTYEDPFSAASAVSWFHGKIVVQITCKLWCFQDATTVHNMMTKVNHCRINNRSQACRSQVYKIRGWLWQ